MAVWGATQRSSCLKTPNYMNIWHDKPTMPRVLAADLMCSWPKNMYYLPCLAQHVELHVLVQSRQYNDMCCLLTWIERSKIDTVLQKIYRGYTWSHHHSQLLLCCCCLLITTSVIHIFRCAQFSTVNIIALSAIHLGCVMISISDRMIIIIVCVCFIILLSFVI